MLDVSPTTIRRKIEAGELPAAQLGGPGSAIRIPSAGLDAWLWPGPEGVAWP
jgi:excisionase family DNA binding protein